MFTGIGAIVHLPFIEGILAIGRKPVCNSCVGTGRMEVTQMSQLLNRFMCWLRADCPEGLAPTDHVPLIALLTRELSPADGMLIAAGEVAE